MDICRPSSRPSQPIRNVRTWIRVLGMLCLTCSCFYLGFELSDSRMDGWRKEAMQAISSNQLWSSYSESAEFEEDSGQKIRMSGQIDRQPLYEVYDADVPIMNGGRFHFKAYHTGDKMWLYDFTQEKWFAAPVNHPALSELSQLQPPFFLCQQIVQHAVKVQRISQIAGVQYVFHIDHLPDGELFSYDLQMAKSAVLAVEVSKTGNLSQIDIQIDFDKSLLLRSNQIHYRITFQNLNQTEPELLPSVKEWTDLP